LAVAKAGFDFVAKQIEKTNAAGKIAGGILLFPFLKGSR
jgi:hypothetical protein